MTEHERAARWRERHGWTLQQLSELTGYSDSAIYWMERGQSTAKRPVNKYAWQRYKLCCFALSKAMADGTKRWNWE
jgi:hypothetical protein